MTHTTHIRILVLAAVSLLGLTALGPAGALAGPQDSAGIYTGISDARDQYLAQHSKSPAPATYSEIAQARDEYLAQHSQGAPATVVAADTPVSSDGGFDWASAVIGAAAGTGLASLLAGSLGLISGRRRTVAPPSTPAV